MANVLIESKRMLARFNKLDEGAQQKVKAEVLGATKAMFNDARNLVGRAVTEGRKGRKVRSRPGQPPRRETGRFWRSLVWKTSPKGWVGYVSTNNRNPWMLESGTEHIKKRPVFRRLQKQMVREYRRRIGQAMIAAVRGAR
jgi:hypothetical protein